MAGQATFERTDGPDGGGLRLSGRWTLARLGDVARRLEEEAAAPARTIDLADVERVDTVGAWLIHRTARDTGATITGASDHAERLIAAVGRSPGDYRIRPDASPPWQRLVADVGRAVRHAGGELLGILAFFGATLIALFQMIAARRSIRWHAIVTRFETVGVNALGIVGLMSFLIGIVIAQQGAVQLQQFGLESFTINLVGRASIRELGLLMTAIMVAGRSGSAFAAQIGTMQLTEEVDALRTIGVSPMEAIVLPRVIAVTLLMPLLGFYASMCAILGGGMFVWAGLGIQPANYFVQIRDIVPMTDFYIMLIKALVFGALIGVTGCYEGMQVKGDAEAVGARTTAAVVQGIFLVIVLDALFAVFFSGLGWN